MRLIGGEVSSPVKNGPTTADATPEDPYSDSWTVVKDPSTLPRNSNDRHILQAQKFLRVNPKGSAQRYPIGRGSTRNWFHTGKQEVIIDLLVQQQATVNGRTVAAGEREVVVIKTATNEYGLVKWENGEWKFVKALSKDDWCLIRDRTLEIGFRPVSEEQELTAWIAVGIIE